MFSREGPEEESGRKTFRPCAGIRRTAHFKRLLKNEDFGPRCRHTPSYQVGDTTASSEPWPISATPFRIRRWETHVPTSAPLSDPAAMAIGPCTRSPNLSAFAEHWLCSIWQECVSKLNRSKVYRNLCRYARKKPAGTINTVQITDTAKPPRSARARGA
jgi:hypothetical protein